MMTTDALQAARDRLVNRLLTFAEVVDVECKNTKIAALLKAKNQAYGNSALDPVRFFSVASASEQIRVRIDDKLSRLIRGTNTDAVPEDTFNDLLGYLVLLRISERYAMTDDERFERKFGIERGDPRYPQSEGAQQFSEAERIAERPGGSWQGLTEPLDPDRVLFDVTEMEVLVDAKHKLVSLVGQLIQHECFHRVVGDTAADAWTNQLAEIVSDGDPVVARLRQMSRDRQQDQWAHHMGPRCTPAAPLTPGADAPLGATIPGLPKGWHVRRHAEVELPIKLLHPDAKMPTKAHASDSGFDLYALRGGLVDPGDTVRIETGVAVQIPPGFEVHARPRSGNSGKGLLVHFGTVDQGYRGDLTVVLTNLSKSTWGWEQGAKIAQFVLAPIPSVQLKQVDELSISDRGTKGFGSSGA